MTGLLLDRNQLWLLAKGSLPGERPHTFGGWNWRSPLLQASLLRLNPQEDQPKILASMSKSMRADVLRILEEENDPRYAWAGDGI